MKKIGKLLLFILTFIFTIILSIVITIFTVRKISSNYISKEYILNSIDKIDINELLLQNGEELEEIKIIKQKLKEAGIEEELINEFISSTPIKEVTKEGIKVSCGCGTILIKKIQFPNGKPLTIQQYINGNGIDVNEILE